MLTPPRICPSCREEYLPEIERCADCGVPLAPAGQEGAAAPGLAPGEATVQLRVESPAWIEALASRLAEAGIPSRVELLDVGSRTARRAGAPCALWVRPEDAERARAIDEAWLRTQLPDLPEEAQLGWQETEACPACGSPADADATECRDCGLAFAEPDAE